MTNSIESSGAEWQADDWESARRRPLTIALAATPAQRLAWLEDAMRLARASGALPKPRADAWQPPSGAVRNAELGAWEVSERDAAGARHGECRVYRDDGSLKLRCHYVEGQRSGEFESYHANGELESRGCYVDGVLDGPSHRYSSGKPGTAPLRSCCVPPGAWELRVRYRRGAALAETFYDAGGRALRS
ncbi:MAG TPA: hypothetical protein VFZ53_26875, partial [Polyangiaceae bacterium]